MTISIRHNYVSYKLRCVHELTNLCDVYYNFALMSLITLFRVVSIYWTCICFYLSVICLSTLSEIFDKDYIIILIYYLWHASVIQGVAIKRLAPPMDLWVWAFLMHMKVLIILRAFSIFWQI